MQAFFVQNFGCRANQADGAALELQLAEAGLTAAPSTLHADVVVLNTCTVTAAADADARHAIRRIKRENPSCRVVVTGCYAQRAAAEIAALEGVDSVIDNARKHALADIVTGRDTAVEAQHGCTEGHAAGAGLVPLNALALTPDSSLAETGLPKLVTGDIFERAQMLVAPTFAAGDKSRPILKVQDGCNSRCSYCVIPYVRGASRSQPLGIVVAQVQALRLRGYNEVVLSGINLGHWGRDLDSGLRLTHLVRAILEHTDVPRLRLSSIEPMDWSDELIGLLAGERRLARHAHVPLQSGSDTVLRRMHRRYRPWHYRERVQRIHQAVPGVAIGADVMVAFPGESDAEFDETRQLVEELPFSYLHVFTYSERPGTAASKHLQQAEWRPVPPSVAAERSRTLRSIAARKHSDFTQSFVGSTLPVITLAGAACGHTDALSDNYLKVRIASKLDANQLAEVAILGRQGDILLA